MCSTHRSEIATGLTLIELLISICIVSVLVSFAFSTRTWIARIEVDSDRTQMAAIINLARSSAIQLNHSVTLCPGSDAGCGHRNEWHLGTVAFVDYNNNKQIDEQDKLLGSIAQLTNRVTWRSFRNRSYLKFVATGHTDWQNGHFKFCPEGTQDHALSRQLVLNAAGRLYFSRDEDGDGLHEDVQGNDLIC